MSFKVQTTLVPDLLTYKADSLCSLMSPTEYIEHAFGSLQQTRAVQLWTFWLPALHQNLGPQEKDIYGQSLLSPSISPSLSLYLSQIH